MIDLHSPSIAAVGIIKLGQLRITKNLSLYPRPHSAMATVIDKPITNFAPAQWLNNDGVNG